MNMRQEYKRKSGPLTRSVYNMFAEYHRSGYIPQTTEMLSEGLFQNKLFNTFLYAQSQKEPCLVQQHFCFVSGLMTLSSRDKNVLECKATGKVMLPKEDFPERVRNLHTRGGMAGREHLGLSSTINMVRHTYSIGEMNFGITEPEIRRIVKQCPDPMCTHKIWKERLSSTLQFQRLKSVKQGAGQDEKSSSQEMVTENEGLVPDITASSSHSPKALDLSLKKLPITKQAASMPNKSSAPISSCSNTDLHFVLEPEALTTSIASIPALPGGDPVGSPDQEANIQVFSHIRPYCSETAPKSKIVSSGIWYPTVSAAVQSKIRQTLQDCKASTGSDSGNLPGKSDEGAKIKIPLTLITSVSCNKPAVQIPSSSGQKGVVMTTNSGKVKLWCGPSSAAQLYRPSSSGVVGGFQVENLEKDDQPTESILGDRASPSDILTDLETESCALEKVSHLASLLCDTKNLSLNGQPTRSVGTEGQRDVEFQTKPKMASPEIETESIAKHSSPTEESSFWGEVEKNMCIDATREYIALDELIHVSEKVLLDTENFGVESVIAQPSENRVTASTVVEKSPLLHQLLDGKNDQQEPEEGSGQPKESQASPLNQHVVRESPEKHAVSESESAPSCQAQRHFGEVLEVISSMRPDVQQAVLEDKLAVDRLKRKIELCQTLIQDCKRALIL